MFLSHNFFHTVRKTSFRIFAISTAVLYLIGLFSWFNSRIPASEPIPKLHAPTENMRQLATPVTVGLHLSGFPVFSIAKGDFHFDGVLWFKFLGGTESLKTLEDVSFQDSLLLRGGKLLFKSPPIVKFIDDEVLVCYHIQAFIKGRLLYKNFPFSDHQLVFLLQNKSVSPRELCFVSQDEYLTYPEDLLVYDWQAAGKKVTTGYIQANLNDNHNIHISYPVVAFAITFENVGIKDLISLYFPLIVLFFIGIFSLFIDLSSESRLTFIAGSVPILVLFRIVIDGVSPQVGYITNIDFFYNLLVLLSLIILIFQTYVVLIMRKIKDATEAIQTKTKERLEKASDLIFIGNLCALVIFVTYSFFR